MVSAVDQQFFDVALKALEVHAPKMPRHAQISAATDISLKLLGLVGPTDKSERGLVKPERPR